MLHKHPSWGLLKACIKDDIDTYILKYELGLLLPESYEIFDGAELAEACATFYNKVARGEFEFPQPRRLDFAVDAWQTTPNT